MDTVRSILAVDPVWAVYPLADLQPAFAPHCQWSVAEAETDAGLALLYRGLTPPVLVTAGAPAAVAQALAQVQLPAAVYLHIREEHEPVVQRWYDNSRDHRAMWRMVFRGEGRGARGDEREAVTTLPRAGRACIRLGPADASRIEALYAHGGTFTPDAFDPYQLADGVFYGLATAAGELAAVGGTHVVDQGASVAAIGNMYTHPAHRRCGYAGAVLAAIIGELRAGNVQTIVLNVDQRNEGARRLYEQHGFVIHCPFIEGIAIRKERR